MHAAITSEDFMLTTDDLDFQPSLLESHAGSVMKKQLAEDGLALNPAKNPTSQLQ